FFVVVVVTSQHVEVLSNCLSRVSYQRVLNAFDTALVAWCVQPCEVREMRVGRATNYGYVLTIELLHSVLERDDLGRANESEVHRVEVEYNVLLANILVKREVFYEFAVHYCCSFERRCFFTY